MARGNLNFKVSVTRLIKALENQKKKEDDKFLKSLKDYESYIKSHKVKIANEIRKIAEQVENNNFSSLNREFRNKISINLKLTFNDKPSKPQHDEIDAILQALKLASDDVITIKQEDYSRYFSE